MSQGSRRPRAYPTLKRTLDVLLSGAALIVLSPVLAVTAAVVRADSPGPVIYKQKRLGRDAQPFTMYKFRTMRVGSEAGGVYEAQGDVRVTKAGRFLRRSSIDELPQLVNIVRGDMSIIGPRPTLPDHPWPIEDYTPEQRRRFDVRPGVTGWAQVNGRKTVEWPQRLELDVHYVDRMSLALDVRILLKTVVRVLRMSDNVNVAATAPAVQSPPREEAA